MNVLVSLDGIGYKIFERYAQKFINNGYSYCHKLITTFPSVTFNAHATAITGSKHDKHFVFDNVITDSKTLERISLYGDHSLIDKDDLHKQTLFHSLSKHSLTSSCIHWPLTSGNTYIDYLITEANSKKSIQEPNPVYSLDNIALNKTILAIQSSSVDFVASRFVGYDALAHKYGKDFDEAIEYIQLLVDYIAQIYDALLKFQASFNLIIFSDHGQSDVKSFFYPNQILGQSPWNQNLYNDQIRFVGDGSGSLLFYSLLDDQENKKIISYFTNFPEVSDFAYIECKNYSRYKPVGILNLNPNVCGEDIMAGEQPQYEDMKSLHGYNPTTVDEMNGFLVCIGSQIERGKWIEQEKIENIAPTLASLFQIPHHCDGKVIKEIIRENE
ncbi:alkaline phosphatase family protein [Domibacillus aminovorans]|uniref:AP protein n=1 Tax=Domibacillus aminovorans TaxID=29332 RepID=A0A177L793_9BACI|nr:alkaline phosphatase family protein [Domibacillus aminovorans]OAH61443.1 AP protein [Domibacillus aminovorans]